MRSIGSCSHCSPIIPIILVRQLQGQLHCILPTGNCSSSAIRPNLSVSLLAPFVDCIWRYCSYPLCHNDNTTKSAFIWKKKIIAVIEATFAVGKRKPEKIQVCKGFEPLTCAIPVQRFTNLTNKPTGSKSLKWFVITREKWWWSYECKLIYENPIWELRGEELYQRSRLLQL